MPQGAAAEIHLVNAKIDLYAGDWGPRESENQKGGLVDSEKRLYQPGMGMRRKTFPKNF